MNGIWSRKKTMGKATEPLPLDLLLIKDSEVTDKVTIISLTMED